MDAWQEEGQIIFSCLLCSFCSVNQLFSSESKNLFQDVNKSKVIRKGNVIPPCCSSLTPISTWKLFKDTRWGRLIGGDESFGTWSWKCLLKWVALWLFAWVISECTCMLQDQGEEGSVLQGPEQTAPKPKGMYSRSSDLQLVSVGICVRLELTLLLDRSQFGQCLPGLNPERLTLNRIGILGGYID